MSAYPQLLGEMMDAILKRDITPARTLFRDKKDFAPEEQLAVYVEGYRLRLAEVLEGAYPALLYVLGKKEFTLLATRFIASTPSRHFNLDKYPVAFAGFVAKETDDVFGCELAMLEAAICEVYQEEETPPLNAQWLEKQTPDLLAAAVFHLRKAARILACSYPVNDYFNAFRAGEKPSRPQKKQSHILVLRHHNHLQRLALAPAEYMLLSLCDAGMPLAQVIEDERLASYVQDEHFSAALMGYFARWSKEGFLRLPS